MFASNVAPGGVVVAAPVNVVPTTQTSVSVMDRSVSIVTVSNGLLDCRRGSAVPLF
jgi:hypothetical protein